MAEYSTPEERTEMPTDRRMGELRKQGAVHMSTEVVQVLSLIGGFMILRMIWKWILEEMKQVIVIYFGMITNPEPLTVHRIYEIAVDLLQRVAPPVATVAIAVSTVATLAVMLQTKWNVKKKWVDIKFTNLNPIGGIKKVFSANGAITTLKSILKLVLILPIGYFALKSYAPEMVMLIHMTVEEVMKYLGLSIYSLFWKIMYVLIALAIFDYFWSKYQWLRQNKMTKDEVKDEKKSIEGDEKTKRKIQAKGLQRIAQRIRDSVPQADVVITNPTHYSIALKYDRDKMSAPIVVAKGKGFLALRIREIARASGVPVLERKPLARALYAATEVGSEIPYELFKAVAEVLAYVYKLRNPYAYATT